MLRRKKQEIQTQSVTEQARAKINLTLDVTGRRENGYHDVEMVMQSIALHDSVTVTVTWGDARDEGIEVTCSLPYLPTDESNLAHRAAVLFYEHTGASVQRTQIHIEKRIPIAAGLAGGSADAAAVLRALNTLHGAGLSVETLQEIGVHLGADVPYCIAGGTVLATGIGEVLAPLPQMPRCHVVVCKPPFAVLTKDIYEAIDGRDDWTHPNTKGMLAALQAQSLADVCQNLGNLMQDVTAQKHPKVLEIRDLLLRHGADGALMSGSGPTVFGLFADLGRAQTAAKMLSHRFHDVFLTAIE